MPQLDSLGRRLPRRDPRTQFDALTESEKDKVQALWKHVFDGFPVVGVDVPSDGVAEAVLYDACIAAVYYESHPPEDIT